MAVASDTALRQALQMAEEELAEVKRMTKHLFAMAQMTNTVLHNLNIQDLNGITSSNEEWRGCWTRMLAEINAALEVQK